MLTPKPTAPALIRVAALASLSVAGCPADDSSMDMFPVDPSGASQSTTDDVHPTAGPCAHSSTMPPPECNSTGPTATGAESSGPDTSSTGGETGGATSTGETGAESGTGSTSGNGTGGGTTGATTGG